VVLPYMVWNVRIPHTLLTGGQQDRFFELSSALDIYHLYMSRSDRKKLILQKKIIVMGNIVQI